jgi:hypothetical protein
MEAEARLRKAQAYLELAEIAAAAPRLERGAAR